RAFFCDRCGGTYANDGAFASPDGDETYCVDCFNAKYWFYYCKEPFNLNERMDDPDGDGCCSDCYNERFFECEDCEETHKNDDRAACDDGRLCQECYGKGAVTCPQCNSEYNTNDEDAVTEHTEVACDDCKVDYFPCEGEHTCEDEDYAEDILLAAD